MRIAIGPSSFAQENPAPLETLKEAGCEIVPNPFGRRLKEDEIIAHLKDVDGLIAGLEPLNRLVLSSEPKLRAVARVGIGVANVDFEAARELDIKVSNTPEGPTDAVAEMTITALLALCRGLIPNDRALHEKKWEKSIGIGLRGLKVLLIGYGRIGRRFADLLRAFGSEILVHDPFIDENSLRSDEKLVSLAEGLRQANAISLHASGNDVILGPEQFAAMCEGAILLNSARGELVDEDALIASLEAGRLKGVWFDAFWDEPYQGRLIEQDRAILTPHVCTYTRQCRLSMETAAVENLLRDLG